MKPSILLPMTMLPLICALLIYYSTASGKSVDTMLLQNSRTTFEALKPLAEGGSAVAQHELGVMYRTGKGTRQDFSQAIRWFRLAARQGLAEAQNNLGGMYVTGQGVKKDFVQAYTWFELAARQGLASARENRDQLGKEMSPEEVTKAREKARNWRPVKIVVSKPLTTDSRPNNSNGDQPAATVK